MYTYSYTTSIIDGVIATYTGTITATYTNTVIVWYSHKQIIGTVISSLCFYCRWTVGMAVCISATEVSIYS